MNRPAALYDIATVIPGDYPSLAAFLEDFPAVDQVRAAADAVPEGPGLAGPEGAVAGPPSGPEPASGRSWGSVAGRDGGRDFWMSRFRLWWDENPAFRPETPRGWMLRQRGRLCGFLANVPSLMLVGGQARTVFSVSTWMVLPEHRERSLDMLFKQVSASEDTLLFDATPTEHVAGILGNLGFELLPWGEDRESYYVLDAGATLRARFQALTWVPAAVWKAAGWCLEAIQSRRVGALVEGKGLRVEEARDAGPAFDRLWERTRAIHPITNVRDARTLRWHCFSDRHVVKRLFACYSADEVAGFMVVKVKARRGLKVLECVDYWADPSQEGVFEALLGFAVGCAASGGFAFLTFGHWSKGFEARLRAAGLFEVALGSRRNYCLVGQGCRAGLGAETSYFTGLQGDYGTSP